MSPLRKYLQLSLFTALLYFGIPTTALAVTEFSTSYYSLYDFTATGSAVISHTIELTNNLAHIYPTTYSLAISSGNMHDIQVKVNTETTIADIEHTTTVTSLHIPIHNPHIGKDQKTTLNVSYNTDSFAEVIGDTYALTLPKTAKGNEASSFIREVRVPISYPELSYSSIAPQNQELGGDSRIYRFVGGGDQTLTLHFGNTSTFNLQLKYHIKNKTAADAVSEIAIPPDTAYQQVTLISIDPKPVEIMLDPDGNWLARYALSANTAKDIVATLILNVSPIPRFFDPSTSNPTGVAPYWEHSSQIKRLATQLKNPRNLYDYLVDNLTYDYSQVTAQKRLGADHALSNPSSTICTDFTDLFVATSRAMGIPSRAIIGYAVTSNSLLRPEGSELDILHAYPEYLSPENKSWIAVDPTWGHTTGGSEYFDRLDFGHLAFVRWGSDSSYPLPAGSYRDPDTPKQLSVTISNEDFTKNTPSYALETEGKHHYLRNTGTQAIIQTKLNLNGRDVAVPYLPPYGRMPVTEVDSPHFSLLSRPILLVALSILVLVTIIILYTRWRNHSR